MKTKKQILLQIAELGLPVIKTGAKPVRDLQSVDVQLLIDNMIATCQDLMGVGIAAPQVYQPLKLFVVASYPNLRYPKAPKMKPLAVINPKIISKSKEIEEDWEGCLSIPGIRALVPRHTSILVEYMTRNGKEERKILKAFVARIFQHEFDHIEGRVILDRVEDTKDLMSEKEYQKMMRLKLVKKS